MAFRTPFGHVIRFLTWFACGAATRMTEPSAGMCHAPRTWISLKKQSTIEAKIRRMRSYTQPTAGFNGDSSAMIFPAQAPAGSSSGNDVLCLDSIVLLDSHLWGPVVEFTLRAEK